MMMTSRAYNRLSFYEGLGTISVDIQTTEFLPHENKEDKHPLGTLREIARLKKIKLAK